jgi:hypothetical protein
MYQIELSASELARRSAAIIDLMKVLLKSPIKGGKAISNTISCNAVLVDKSYILATFDGSKLNDVYRDWRFSSYRHGFRCMYFEEWVPVDANKKAWLLKQMAFSLFRILPNIRKEVEVLAIHCEPLEPDGQQHIRYKRGLHLHVVLAQQPIPHAHFSINDGFVSNVMSNINSFSDALKSALEMVNDQVIRSAD